MNRDNNYSYAKNMKKMSDSWLPPAKILHIKPSKPAEQSMTIFWNQKWFNKTKLKSF